MNALAECLWAPERLGEGMESLARHARLRTIGPACGAREGHAGPGAPPPGPPDGEWIAWAAQRLGFEAEPIESPVGSVTTMLRGAAPMLIWIDAADASGYLLVVRAGPARLQVLGTDGRPRTVRVAEVRDALCEPVERKPRREILALLEHAGIAARRRARVAAAMLRERVGTETVGQTWMLRPAPTAGLRTAWRDLRLSSRLCGLLAAFAAFYAMEVAGWSLIGRAALDGRLDLGWMWAWFLMVISLVPLRMAAQAIDARIGVSVGQQIKQRLLAGALRLPPDALRADGVGGLLGRVLESQALESLALSGALSVLVALLELAVAATVLAWGAGGAWHLALLAGWLGLVIAWSHRYHRRLRDWVQGRLALTGALLEDMIGHRTRLAQDNPARRDRIDDRAMLDYLGTSRRHDLAAVPLLAAGPGGWLLLGMAGLAPVFAQGRADPLALAVGLGGVLMAHRALAGLAAGAASIARANVAWDSVAALWHAAATPAPSPAPYRPIGGPAGDPRARLVDANRLIVRQVDGGPAVLDGIDLTIHAGDRILLEGASGSGKSTLAAVLTGLRAPSAGLLLLDGLDRPTLGDQWHRLATQAPQFHENHILGGSLAFNLLMGQGWPASAAQLERARTLCEDLGLGPLIARMPAGLMQTVGETGWQLSHGERSRVFLARALLQRAPLTILDESFAALDPPTLKNCLDAAFTHTRALVVIAHP